MHGLFFNKKLRLHIRGYFQATLHSFTSAISGRLSSGRLSCQLASPGSLSGGLLPKAFYYQLSP